MKKESKAKSFSLFPPESIIGSWSKPTKNKSTELNEYINMLFSNVQEKGEKNILLYTFVTKIKNYEQSDKGKYLRDLFGRQFESFKKLKNVLKMEKGILHYII